MKLAERIFRRNDYYITSKFGTRKDPITSVSKMHNGCDYGTNVQNWSQYALEEGVVIGVKTGVADKDTSGGYGNYVKVKYPRLNIQLLHAHLKEVKVKLNQSVTKDTILGTTGTSGYSTGIHLHLGYQKIGSSTWLDPESYDYKENDTKMKFKIGDKVVISGKLYPTSSSSTATGTVTNKVTNITRVASGAKHPYNTTNDIGWMNETDITLYSESTSDYKQLYEKELLKNKDLQNQLNQANSKIKQAIEILN